MIDNHLKAHLLKKIKIEDSKKCLVQKLSLIDYYCVTNLDIRSVLYVSGSFSKRICRRITSKTH